MYNLIRKDFIIQKKALLILFPILFVYLILNTANIWIGFVFSIVIIMNTFSMDEKPNITALLNSLPYTRKEIVSSKYIGVLIFTLFVIFALFIGNYVIHRELIDWKEIMFIMSLVMMVTSFTIPFSYQFKSQYLLIGSLFLFIGYLIIANTLVKNINDEIRNLIQFLIELQGLQSYLLFIVPVIVIYGCSWLLSIRIYRKKGL